MRSSAADEVYDFNDVSLGEETPGVLCTDDDLMVYLHGDGPSGEGEMLHEPAHGEPFRDLACLAVDRHPHRGIIC
jgi:hypothetical protein